MGKEIVLRYVLAVVFGCVSIAVMTSSFDSAFDGIASTSLFGCIASVANEDESLGPVIHKGMNRFGGACLGGFCGTYVFSYAFDCFTLHALSPVVHLHVLITILSLSGFLCIMIRDVLPPLPDFLLLILIPCIFVFL
jgi:hypothetical protein